MSFGGSGSGNGSISSSSDVALSNPADGQLLTYNAGLAKWRNLVQVNPLPENVNTVASSGITETLPDVKVATIHYVTLTANCTLTFPAAAAGKSFLVFLVQDGTGNRTVVWPGSVKWQGGTAPTLSTAAGSTDVVSFICPAGSSWFGFPVGQGF